jgi:hypothetical protein
MFSQLILWIWLLIYQIYLQIELIFKIYKISIFKDKLDKKYKIPDHLLLKLNDKSFTSQKDLTELICLLFEQLKIKNVTIILKKYNYDKEIQILNKDIEIFYNFSKIFNDSSSNFNKFKLNIIDESAQSLFLDYFVDFINSNPFNLEKTSIDQIFKSFCLGKNFTLLLILF